VPGSRLACAPVRRRWPARAAEKGAGGVPRAVFCFLFPTRRRRKARTDNERPKAKLPTAARRNIVSSKAPSAVPVERGASYT
jgi:hypothetical protein